MSKLIKLNAFDMNCVGHIQQGLWTHPRDQSTRYLDLKYWTDYAKRLEEAGVAVTSMHLADHMHGMLTQGKVVRAAVVVSGFVCQWIGQALSQN